MLIHQFGKGVSLENIAVRSNGQLLVTRIDQPEIYQVNPSRRQAPALLGTAPYAAALFGIAEASTDIFAFEAGSYPLCDTQPCAWFVLHLDNRYESNDLL